METIEVAMNEKNMAIILTGPINTASVKRLVQEMDYGFDYYQFSGITVQLDSPGGEYKAMLTLLDCMKRRQQANQLINMQATHVCASAAALVHAHGTWGTRTVEPDTHLLFHWARALFQVGQVVTSDMAVSLAKGLSTVDQKILERLVASMCAGAGGEQALVDTMSARLDSLLLHWDETARALSDGVDGRSANQCDWAKVLQKNIKRWQAECDVRKQVAGVVLCLKSRFEKDLAMDLREAYALCLIDVVKGILPVQKAAQTKQNMVVNVEATSVSDISKQAQHTHLC